MTGKVRGQEEGGLTHSLGRARSESAVQFRDLEQARAAEGSLMTREELKPFREKSQNQFDQVVEALAPFDKYPNRNAFDRLDNLSEAMGKIAKRPASAASVLASFDYVGITPQALSDVKKFALSLKDAPTEYFEAKPQRAVGLNEFKAAIVPESTSQDVVDALRGSGLYVEKYTDNANRITTVERVSGDQGLRFMPSDTDYLSAVQQGDTQAAQRMVDEAAKAAGYPPKVFYHGTQRDFTVFDKSANTRNDFGRYGKGFYFTKDKYTAAIYAGRNPFSGSRDVDIPKGATIHSVYLDIKNPKTIEAKDIKMPSTMAEAEATTQKLIEEGYDGVVGVVAGNAESPNTEYVVFSPSQIKSADPITYDDAGNVIPLSKRFQKTSDDIRYMPSDDEYLNAVKRGSTKAAQDMVDAAAKAAGYTVGPLFHGTRADFNKFQRGDLGIHFGTQEQASNRGSTRQIRSFLKANPLRIDDDPGFWMGRRLIDLLAEKGIDKSALIKISNKAANEGGVSGEPNSSADILARGLMDLGIDAIQYPNKFEGAGDSIVVLDPTQIKSADPITRDDSGNVIPLSQRFKATSEDIRFMPSPDSAMPGAYSFPGGYRALPGKAKGSLRIYGPAGSLIGIAASLDEAQRILRRKNK